MSVTHSFAASALIVVALGIATSACAQSVTRYVRYEHAGTVAYGILDGEVIHELGGDLFSNPQPTGRRVAVDDVGFLPPTDASKVIAVGLNYQSHLGDREPASEPGLFAKYPTSLIGHGETIRIPEGSANLHYEGEMVLVIGATAQNVSPEEAMSYVFGVTAGNDISERDWQSSDLQWFRAKASDGFGPVGPAIAVGVDPDDLLLQTRVNGEVRQSERTADLIFDVATIVSYVSRYVTLQPGDLIFTGTPGTTMRMRPGDVVEIELEGVGVLRNPVVGPPPAG